MSCFTLPFNYGGKKMEIIIIEKYNYFRVNYILTKTEYSS